ncbi:DNA-binding CsgD family transcriptional regulator [Lentzea atacamensis]|uniref:DNA-binding CsgD family transcriptional regulator n=1 Tax=Lentzea atacamensis TaxID=531938 RepID=A0A316HZD7_9PSEU|nr:helix-turn-helix transcriptional regulator [Lentzea atacamensis]PWK85539.1 DNA-binding CsgD family transcriptional regulator [Lentzea atacamensis]
MTGQDLMAGMHCRNIAFLDSAFQLREVSVGFAKQFDCRPADLVGTDFTCMFGPDHEMVLLGLCLSLQRTGDGVFREHLVVRRGRVRQVLGVVVRAVQGGFVASAHPSARPHAGFTLSAANARILERVAEGRTADQIAADLDIGEQSARNRIAAVLAQFGETSQSSALSKAYAWGVLDPSVWPPRVVPARSCPSPSVWTKAG